MKKYLLNIAVALDQVGTTIIGGFPDETMSSYAYRMERKDRVWGHIWRPTIDWAARVFFGQRNHCYLSYEAARARVHSPPELR